MRCDVEGCLTIPTRYVSSGRKAKVCAQLAAKSSGGNLAIALLRAAGSKKSDLEDIDTERP